MKNFNSLRKTFVRQTQPNNCGLACLSMILNYVGKIAEADQLSDGCTIHEDGISLLDLHKLAAKYDIKSRCVKMDLDYLSTVSHPAILHVINGNEDSHFIVCYGLLKENGNYFMIGDPARQMSLISKSELDSIWRTKSALFFEKLDFSNQALKDLRSFSNYRLPYPFAVWIAIPLLNVFAATLGITLSWAIQKATDDFLSDGHKDLIIVIPLLLFILMLFRSLVHYVRQLVLIKLNNSICEKYLNILIQVTTLQANKIFAVKNEYVLRSRMADVQKIQSGLSMLVTVLLSEGALIILLLSAMFYLDPISGLINVAGIFILLGIAGMNSSFFSSNLAYLNDLSSNTENALVNESGNIEFDENAGLRIKQHQGNYMGYLAQAKKIGQRLGRVTLLYECISTVVTLLVFSRCLLKIQSLEMSNATMVLLVISSYFITSLTLKICSAWNIIAEGKEATRLFAAGTRII